MAEYRRYATALALSIHGLIHLLGIVVYFELAAVADLPYKTTLLGGVVDVGDTGIRVFGALNGVAAVGFVASAVALVAGWRYWRALLVAVTLFSLLLTTLDWTVASTGILANLAILAALFVHARFRT
ncbi:ABC transporter permease [Natronolimnohabitans sp. A-GB9]|uniref:ABC transporter permease n=1 Tax=Natronolimnohabitans sp. A-GB9 TaxID=3069757 RepID=UPI0027AECAAE|nr:ABC transporter permease [Natronolimnohabitans sp. A-GB9]MDQ2049997.1 ABC transporter permease [Natronolimnohabitans sp. A-GB9]